MPKEISFKVSKADRALIDKIVSRTAMMWAKAGGELDRISLEMDLCATHANGNRMDFARLLAADDFNFGHDVGGIIKYLDRTTGTLTNCFLPRCSTPKRKLLGRTSNADKRAAAFVGKR